jgi:hypothetical protein
MWGSIVASFVRWFLMLEAGWLIQHGVWSQSQADQYVSFLAAGIVTALGTLAWSLWQKYHARVKLLTALASPAGTTPDELAFRVTIAPVKPGAPKAVPVILLAAALGLASLGSGGCAQLHLRSPFGMPSSVTTDAGRQAYTADQIVQQVAIFQHTVVDLADRGVISVTTARSIVAWTVATLRTIQASPNGWEATVREGWRQVRPKVVELPAVAPWGPTIDALIGFVTGGGL